MTEAIKKAADKADKEQIGELLFAISRGHPVLMECVKKHLLVLQEILDSLSHFPAEQASHETVQRLQKENEVLKAEVERLKNKETAYLREWAKAIYNTER